jgi:hypothetical protein
MLAGDEAVLGAYLRTQAKSVTPCAPLVRYISGAPLVEANGRDRMVVRLGETLESLRDRISPGVGKIIQLFAGQGGDRIRTDEQLNTHVAGRNGEIVVLVKQGVPILYKSSGGPALWGVYRRGVDPTIILGWGTQEPQVGRNTQKVWRWRKDCTLISHMTKKCGLWQLRWRKMV